MNVIQINTQDTKGGAAKIAQQLHRFLISKGNKSNLFVKIKSGEDLLTHQIENSGIVKTTSDLIRPIFKKDLFNFLKYNQIKVTADDISFFKRNNINSLSAYLESNIVHAHNLHGDYFPLRQIISMSKEKKFVWTLHDMWAITGHCCHTNCNYWNQGCPHCNHLDIYQSLPWNNSHNLWKIKQNIYNKSNINVVVPCKWLKDKVEMSILKNQRIHHINNGIDTNIFTEVIIKNYLKQSLNIPKNKRVALFISYGGFENKWKGGLLVKTLTEHFIHNNEWVFVCVGSYNKIGWHGNVLHVPELSDENIIVKYHQVSDVFLLPSVGETSPLSIIEAMSTGSVVISSNKGGIPELLSKDYGFMLKELNTKNLVEAFSRVVLLSNEEVLCIGKMSREKVLKDFSLERMLDKYINLYQNILSNNND